MISTATYSKFLTMSWSGPLVAVAFSFLPLAPSAAAATVAQGATLSDGAGGIVLTNGNPLALQAHSSYSNEVTTPTSEWVWDAADATQSQTLTFQFLFDLSGYNTSTASLTGLWGIDNAGDIFLNGNLISSLPDETAVSNFSSLTAILVNAGSSFFLSGANVLVFSLFNDAPPAAFRAAVTVSADAAAVPLPAAFPLFAAGLSAMGFMGWRRKRKALA